MRRHNATLTADSPNYTRRTHNHRLIGWVPMGPVYLTLTTYKDGRRSWGVSEPGCSSGHGDGAIGRAEAKRVAMAVLVKRVPVPEGASVYSGGARWIGGKVVDGRHDGRGGWNPIAAS